MNNNNQKSAFIAVVGRANVGKSSFVNSAVGQKVAIVSDKPQTTRTRIMGVMTRGSTQLVYIDTPGFHKPKNLLGENMIKAVEGGMADVDAVTLIVEAVTKFKGDDVPPAEITLVKQIKKHNAQAILAINKIDLLKDKSELLRIIEKYKSLYDFTAVVPFSAKTGDGMEILIEEQMKFAVPSMHFFDDSAISDQPESVMVSEIIREKMLCLLDKEIPHGVAVGLEQFYERDLNNGEPILEVQAVVYCEKESHKGIIIGKRGAMLKEIGTQARHDIEKFFGCKCNLKIWVKVKEDWRNRQGLIHSFGLDSNKR